MIEYIILMSPLLIIGAGLYAKFQMKLMKLEEDRSEYTEKMKALEQRILNQKLFSDEIISYARDHMREHPELYEYVRALQSVYKL